MPTVNCEREKLLHLIGRELSEEELDEICFEYGLEIDDVVVDENKKVTYKIEVGANRYDLLSVEGIAQCISTFLGVKPYFECSIAKNEDVPNLFIRNEENIKNRPYVVLACVRNLDFTLKNKCSFSSTFNSLLELQEKLHFNLGQKRKLLAIGVHDMDKITLPLSYSVDASDKVSFRSLICDTEKTAEKMLADFESTHLKPYLEYVKSDENVVPVIRDANNQVLSMPPIINSYATQVTESTRNILIECTGNDLNKLNTVLYTVALFLCVYSEGSQITPGVVVNKGAQKLFPTDATKSFDIDTSYLNTLIGIDLSSEEYQNILNRMGYAASSNSHKVIVSTPKNRFDILHECDVMEDAAICYGFNKINQQASSLLPCKEPASEIRQHRYADKLRVLISQCGFLEVCSFIVASYDDLTSKMLFKDEQNEIAQLFTNTHELNSVRNSLIPNMLKTLASNKNLALPQKIFEISQVSRLIPSNVQIEAENNTRICVMYTDKTSGFEVVHGILDKILFSLLTNFSSQSSNLTDIYQLVEISNDTFLNKRSANIVMKNVVVGVIGILNPVVLRNFELTRPVTVLDLNFDLLVKQVE